MTKKPVRPAVRKKSKWCFKCKKQGKKKAAVQYASGSFDTYCRDHKADYMKKWMAKRRRADPGYGQVGTAAKNKKAIGAKRK